MKLWEESSHKYYHHSRFYCRCAFVLHILFISVTSSTITVLLSLRLFARTCCGTFSSQIDDKLRDDCVQFLLSHRVFSSMFSTSFNVLHRKIWGEFFTSPSHIFSCQFNILNQISNVFICFFSFLCILFITVFLFDCSTFY